MNEIKGYSHADAEKELHEYMTDGKDHCFKAEEGSDGSILIYTHDNEFLCSCDDAIGAMLIIKNMRIARHAIQAQMKAAALAAVANALHQKFGGDKAKMDEEVAKHPEIQPFTPEQVDFLMGLANNNGKNN